MLRGVDLDLPAHTLIRVEGTNGTGKSTLLRLLAGIDSPTEGRITGRRPRTAYVPERFPAALPFTATGYLVHLGRIHGLPTAGAADRARYWLDRFGAAAHARTPLAELSKGTSQKVAVAQALLAGPELLILDEAWTGLDAAARAELDLAVAERVAAGATVVYVDHDPGRLAGSADTVLRIGNGTLSTAPAPPAAGAAPRVRVEVSGPPGASLPTQLPGAPEPAPGSGGHLVLTVAADRSDALLHALLTAHPPWHIRALTTAPGPAEQPPTADGSVPADGSPPTEGPPPADGPPHPAPTPEAP
ncbi:ATP-binding cassette domain-containing protein [Streptomyces sp. NPDC052095]|uniref:ATP-binding cassette domain-containing protein n=1 Tax=unclassified Streptomyces TaxID=2593676 RepID=UPI00344CA9EC